jgi:hypothetical protein
MPMCFHDFCLQLGHTSSGSREFSTLFSRLQLVHWKLRSVASTRLIEWPKEQSNAVRRRKLSARESEC